MVSITDRIMGVLTARRAELEPSALEMNKQRSKPQQNYWYTYADEIYNKDRKIMDYVHMVETDSQIKAALDLIQNSLASQKYMIKPASAKKEDIEIAGFVEEVIEGMSIPFRSIRKDALTALAYGYSVFEIVYRYDDKTKKIVWDYLRSIDIETLDNCFTLTPEGDVKTVIQTPIARGMDRITIPAEYCLIYSYDCEFGNPYGRSILRQCYDHWFMKRKVLKWYNIYLQKLQNPFLHGKTGNPADAANLQEVLDNIGEGRTNAVTNREDEINVIESSHKGPGFLEAIQHHNMMIFRRMGIPTLIFGQDSASGSYAQSQSHQEVFHEFLEGVQEEVAGLFEEKIQELVDLNYPNVENYPRFFFEPLRKDEIIQLLMALQPLAANGNVDTNMPWFQNLVHEAVERNSNVVITPEDKAWEHVQQFSIELQPKEALQDPNKYHYTYTYTPKGGDQQQQPNQKPQKMPPGPNNPQERQSIAARATDEERVEGIRKYLHDIGLLRNE